MSDRRCELGPALRAPGCCVKELPLGPGGGTTMLSPGGVWSELCSRKITGVRLMRSWTKGGCKMDKKDEDEELSDASMFLTWVDLATLQLIQKKLRQKSSQVWGRSPGLSLGQLFSFTGPIPFSLIILRMHSLHCFSHPFMKCLS